MKKLFLLTAIATLSFMKVVAQTNLQVFYDFGSDRRHVTTTFEMFKADKWGDTFFFIDHDFNTKDSNHQAYAPSGTYFEIARGLNFWQDTKFAPFSLHVEYNGGVYQQYPINNAWLFGVNYFLHSADFKNTLTLEAMYKTIARIEQDVPLQFTAVWGMKDIFGVEGLNFSGFADFWWEDHQQIFDENGDPKLDSNGKEQFKKSTVFISEPQLWYNVGRHFGCPNLNIGGEVELSADFGTYDGFKCNPCLGVKWEF